MTDVRVTAWPTQPREQLIVKRVRSAGFMTGDKKRMKIDQTVALELLRPNGD
jgi:hypothetical protein